MSSKMYVWELSEWGGDINSDTLISTVLIKDDKNSLKKIKSKMEVNIRKTIKKLEKDLENGLEYKWEWELQELSHLKTVLESISDIESIEDCDMRAKFRSQFYVEKLRVW